MFDSVIRGKLSLSLAGQYGTRNQAHPGMYYSPETGGVLVFLRKRGSFATPCAVPNRVQHI